MRTKRIVAIVTTTVIALTGVVFAATPMQSINVSPNTAKVVVNGKNLSADNFNYNGTIYIPLRAVSEQMGANVDWDQTSKTATITNSSSGSDNLEIKSAIFYYSLLENSFDDAYDVANELAVSLIYCDTETLDTIVTIKSMIHQLKLTDKLYSTFTTSGIEDLKRSSENYNNYLERANKCATVLENYKKGAATQNDLQEAINIMKQVLSNIRDDRQKCRDHITALLYQI